MNVRISIPDITTLAAFQTKPSRESKIQGDSPNGFRDFLGKATDRLHKERILPERRGFQTKETNSLKEPEDQDNEMKTHVESSMKRMADVLGISMQDFLKLLQLANVKPEEMLDPQQSTAAAEKLLKLLDLTHIQRSSFLNALALSSSVTLTKEGINGEQSIGQLTGMDPQDLMIPEPLSSKDFEEILAQIRAKLQETEGNEPEHYRHLSEADSGKTAFINEEGFRWETAADEPGGMIHQDTNFESMIVAGKGSKEGGAAGENAFDHSPYKEETTDMGYTATEIGSGEVTMADGIRDSIQIPIAHDAPKGKDELNDGEIVPDIQVMDYMFGQPFRVQNNSLSYRLVDTSKYDIISQVAEKAKVLLTPEKSEMVVDLKPDFLGKLSLKIVTERGMVSAQFIAESQQVKEILEGNMQLLKDALEKQGFNVQEFNVSVGQNQTGNSESNSAYSQGKGLRNIRAKISVPGVVSGMDSLERILGNDPYLLDGSSINLTA